MQLLKKDQKTRNEEIRLAAKREAEEVLALARRCLGQLSFTRYKDRALKAREKIMKDLTNYHDSDPLRYAFGMAEIVNNIRNMEALLRDIEMEAGR